MRAIENAALLHNALASMTAAYGATLTDIQQELAAANAAVVELKGQLEIERKKSAILARVEALEEAAAKQVPK